jgi:transposase-like protein
VCLLSPFPLLPDPANPGAAIRIRVYDTQMNPLWTQAIFNAVKEVMKICPHCKKVSAYNQKKIGQFYKCHHCGHRFKETGK